MKFSEIADCHCVGRSGNIPFTCRAWNLLRKDGRDLEPFFFGKRKQGFPAALPWVCTACGCCYEDTNCTSQSYSGRQNGEAELWGNLCCGTGQLSELGLALWKSCGYGSIAWKGRKQSHRESLFLPPSTMSWQHYIHSTHKAENITHTEISQRKCVLLGRCD